MRTQDFIITRKGTTPSKDIYCSSVMLSTNGNFYSYGYHYPLLVKCNGYWLRNIKGYSSSTARHICWASGDFDINLCYHDDDFRYSSFYGDKLSPKKLKKCVKNEIKEKTKELKALSKRAFRQKQILESRISELEAILSTVF